jgi:predicted DNA repair protein MutK
MSVGLLALLDDVAAIAKIAASSVDDIAALSGKAGLKAAGVVIDDAAVTPRYVIGFGPKRELPIVGKIALGSLRNKLLILLPIGLALTAFLPQAILPLLMLGGLYLCYEGVEKLFHHHDATVVTAAPQDAEALERERVSGAIRTDFILSAEIMAITLGQLEDTSFWMRALVLAIVSIAITVAVYGAVALIVKADDAGLAMSQGRSGVTRAIGRGLVKGMPVFLKVLGAVAVVAMLWVGGGIVLHGLEGFGWNAPAHLVHEAAVAAGNAVPGAGGLVEWLVGAVGGALTGLVLGGVIVMGMKLVRSH